MSKNLQLQVIFNAIDKATGPIKALMNSSGGLGKQLKQTRDQLKGLQSQQSNIQSFKSLKAASEQSKQAMSEQQQKVKELAAGMRQAEVPTKAMTKEFQAATREAHRLKQNHNANSQQLQAMRGKLSEAGISTRNLSEAERGLRDRISETNKSLTDQQNRLKHVTDQQKRLSAAKAQYEKTTQLASNMTTAGAGAMAAGGGVLYGGAQLLQEGMQFDANMSKVQAMSGLGKSDEQMKMLRDQAKQLGAETMFSANDAARGQAFLAIAGFTPESIQAAMPGLLDMALAGDIDLGRTADIASNILGGFKIDPSEMGRVSDVLTKAFITSNTSLESLGETMKYVAPVAKKAGMSLETTAAMAGLLGNVGIQGSQAGTSLKSMILNLSGPASVGQKALKKLGIAATDSAGDLRKPELILADLAKATEKLGSAQQIDYLKMIFGKEPAAAMAELMGEAGLGGLQEYMKKVQDNNSAASRTAKTMADNLVGDLDELSSAWDGLKIDVFEGQNDDLRKLTKSFTDVIGMVATWAKENPQLVATIIKSIAVLAALVAAGGALMLTIGSILGPLAMMKYGLTVLGIKSLSIIPALKGIGAAIMLIGKAMIASPLGLFAAAAVIAAVLIVKYWDVVKAFFNGFISGFIDGFMNMGRAVIDAFNPVIPVFKAVMSAASKAFAWFKELLAPVSSAKETLEGAASAGKTFGQVLGAFAALTGAALAIKAVGTAVLFVGKALLANPVFFAIALLAGAAYMVYENWDGIVGGLKQMWADLGQWWSDKSAVLAADWEFIAGKAAAAWGSVTEFFSGVWAGITGAFDGGMAGIGALILNWSPLGLFYQVFAGVMSYFGVDLPGKFSEFGGMIMQGLISGIKNMAGGVKDAVVGMGDSVGGWFKDKLGIRSPSRVFMQFGGDTAEGLALGIAANKDSPLKQVAEMAKSVAAAGALTLASSMSFASDIQFDTRPPIASPVATMQGAAAQAAQNSSAAGNTIHYHINVSGGGDPKSLADEVLRQIEAYDRAKQVRKRSTFGDLD